MYTAEKRRAIPISQVLEPFRNEPKPDLLDKLNPLLDAANTVYKGVIGILDQKGLNETRVLGYLNGGIILSPAEKAQPAGRDLDRLAHQYDHVRKVVGATLELKRQFIEDELPDRIVAYQTGTGWPLPEENENLKKVGFIHYGTGALSEFSPPGSEADEEAGMHIYRLKVKDDENFTLLALKGRMHGYTETENDYAAHDLAFMPRVLKGIGTEFILSTFASGIDPYIIQEGQVDKHDLAILYGASDSSGLSAHMGPGTGDQRILMPVFGGPFQGIAAMNPDMDDAALFKEVVDDLRNNELKDSTIKPRVHPAIETDTNRTPNFQDLMTHAMPQVDYEQILRNGTLPGEVIDLFENSPLALVHGMVQIIERDAYFQSLERGIPSPWNRRLRELPIVTFTDYVDPGGQSKEISDEEVRRSADEAKSIMTKVVTNFFKRYANPPLYNF